MEWVVPDLALKHQVRLVNWPTSLTSKSLQPGPNWKSSAVVLDATVPSLKRKHLPEIEPDFDDDEGRQEWEEERERGIDSAVRIESWTDGESAFRFGWSRTNN